MTERAQILYKTYNPFSRPNGQLVCTKTNEEFQELFEKTFEIGLGVDTPYTAAAFGILGVGEDLISKLADLQPTPFATAAAGFADYIVGGDE